jgi:hypothetical protein
LNKLCSSTARTFQCANIGWFYMEAGYNHWVFNVLKNFKEKPPERVVFLDVFCVIRTANISLQDPCSWPSNQRQPADGLAYQVGIR